MNHHFFQAKNLDLAMEATSCLRGKSNREIEGIRETIRRTEHTQITEIEILNEKGAQRMGRSIGNYITVEIPELTRYNESSFVEDIVWTIIGVLRHLYTAPKDKPTLIIGLGNLFTIPDSLGPEVLSHIQPTAHIFPELPQETREKICPLCLFTPGVLGNTGIPTFDTVYGIVKKIQPAGVLIIDALATCSITRICNTIQMTDTGIRPGSGISRNNKEINSANLGIPVIAIGIPTIVHAGVIIEEALSRCFSHPNLQGSAVDDQVISDTIEALLHPYSGDLMVTPKEIDTMIPVCAKILAKAIVRTVHPGLTSDNYQELMQ